MAYERTAVLLGSWLAACFAPTGSYEGRIVDPWTGSGRGGVKVIARAPNDVLDAACQVTEGTTSSDGTFRLERTCADVTYTLRVDDPKLVVHALDDDVGRGVAEALGSERLSLGRVLVANPRGLVIVSYPPDVEQKELLRDLKRLLTGAD